MKKPTKPRDSKARKGGRPSTTDPKAIKVTVTLYPEDIDYLKTLSRNMSEAARQAINKAREASQKQD